MMEEDSEEERVDMVEEQMLVLEKILVFEDLVLVVGLGEG